MDDVLARPQGDTLKPRFLGPADGLRLQSGPGRALIF